MAEQLTAAHEDVAGFLDEGVAGIAIDLAEALGRCIAVGGEHALMRATISWSERARLHGRYDPIPTNLEISVYSDDEGRAHALGFYLIASENGDEIAHSEHRTLAQAVAAAQAEFGVARAAWQPAG
jgi:hypothetical protein